MSKLADHLRLLNLFNNYEILRKWGRRGDVAIDYYAPDGRACEPQRTEVWSPIMNRHLEPIRKFGGTGFLREFIGPRKESLPAAFAWAEAKFKTKYAPSPFGGYIPVRLRQKAVLEAAYAATLKAEGKGA